MEFDDIEILDLTLEHVPLYGTFKFFDKIRLIDDIFLESVKKYFDGQSHLIITDYLYENGFVIKRLDVDETGEIIQLTDLGRKLKECGSFISYHGKLANEESDLQSKNYYEKANAKLLTYTSLSVLILALITIFEFLASLELFCSGD